MINLFLKSIIVGIAKIIPGLSGAVLAISFGIYEKAIDKVSNFFKDLKNNIYYLSTLVLGIILGIIIGAFVIKYLYTNMYHFTIFLFIGLIVGVTLKFDFKINSAYKKVLLLILAIIFTFFISLNFVSNEKFIYDNSIYCKVYTTLIGFIDAFSTIVPGISGTAIFISMGCYDFVLGMFSSSMFTSSAIIYFSIGLFLGVIIISLFMNYMFKKHNKLIYSIIYILCISSIIMMFLNVDYTGMNFIVSIISILSFILGIFISKKIS